MGSHDTGIDTTLFDSTPMSTSVADNVAMFQAAVSIIMVYTQADTVQPAYTGTETDVIVRRCRQIPFHTVRILGRVNRFCYRQVSVIPGFSLTF
jgi:hypothetical protein